VRPRRVRLTIGSGAVDGQSLHDVYRVVLWVQVGLNAAAGVWALGAHRWQRLRGRPLWVFTGFAEAVVVANVVMASVLLARYDWAFPDLHMLYEFSGLVSIGIMYSYAQQMRARRFLIYGGGGLWLMGLALRSLFMS
jgi:hypothetical protein